MKRQVKENFNHKNFDTVKTYQICLHDRCHGGDPDRLPQA